MIKPLINTMHAYMQSVALIARSAKLIGLCIIPWVGGLLLWGGLFVGSLFFRDTLAHMLFSETASWLSALIEGALIPALFLLTAVLAVLVSLIICEFTTDPLIINIFERLGVANLPYRSTTQQMLDGLIRFIIITPLSILCFIFGFIPIVGLPFFILSFFLVGFGLIDLPLSIRGDRWGSRMSFIVHNWLSVLALGAFFALSFLVPGLSLVLLPIGYAAGVFLIQSCSNNSS